MVGDGGGVGLYISLVLTATPLKAKHHLCTDNCTDLFPLLPGFKPASVSHKEVRKGSCSDGDWPREGLA